MNLLFLMPVILHGLTDSTTFHVVRQEGGRSATPSSHANRCQGQTNHYGCYPSAGLFGGKLEHFRYRHEDTVSWLCRGSQGEEALVRKCVETATYRPRVYAFTILDN